jgi:hypothetical protein
VSPIRSRAVPRLRWVSRGRLPPCPLSEPPAQARRVPRDLPANTIRYRGSPVVTSRNGEPWGIRAARNQSMFRAVNARLHANANGGAQARRIACECADTECTEAIEIGKSEYERLRDDPNLFAVLEAHVYPEVEDIVEASRGFVVVAKRGEARELVSRTHEPANA